MKAKIIVTLYIKNVTGALYTVNYNENTLSVSVSVNAAWNSVVLTARRNDCSEVAALTDVQLPLGRRGHQVWSGALTARSASTLQQTGDADGLGRRRTSGLSQRGTSELSAISELSS